MNCSEMFQLSKALEERNRLIDEKEKAIRLERDEIEDAVKKLALMEEKARLLVCFLLFLFEICIGFHRSFPPPPPLSPTFPTPPPPLFSYKDRIMPANSTSVPIVK